MVLGQKDYVQGAEMLAPKLVGKVLCRRTPEGEVLRRRITETECYSKDDSACHAYRGKTPRNAVMYRQGGVAYVYICYGIHHLLNVVTGAEGSPEAVLIRGVEGFSGPGRLTKGLGIDKSANALALTPENGLWLEDDGTEVVVETGRRIGIGYARQEDQERLWRFFVKHKSKC